MAISIHTKFHEAFGKLNAKQLTKFKTWREGATKDGKYPPVEAQFNCINSILAGETKESTPAIKNNGRADNGHVLLTESATLDGGGDVPDTLAKAHKLCEQYVTLHRLSEADARKVVGLPTKKREETGLSEAQYRWLEFATLAGRDEAAALREAKVR